MNFDVFYFKLFIVCVFKIYSFVEIVKNTTLIV